MPSPDTLPQHIQWIGDAVDGHLRLLDQTRLPAEEVYLECQSTQEVWDAIKCLAVRGAPAIGIAAAYGCVLGLREGDLDRAAEHLATSRPTAVNLFWALERMKRVVPRDPDALLEVARKVHREDAEMCHAIGQHGLPFIDRMPATRRVVVTHCNAGALATGGVGTATAPIYLAHEQGLPLRVFADETRPLLQGARLTAYELARAGVDVTLMAEAAAASVLRSGSVGLVITGADRIAANGDVANKIGTYPLAVLAREHRVPFVVAAPSSTFDLDCPTGMDIPIEERSADEVTHFADRATAPDGVAVFNPAFDVTPAELITALITERGVIQPVSESTIQQMLV